MVRPEVTRRVLTRLGEALPDDRHDFVNRIDIRDGWGDTIFVRVHSPLPRTPENHDRWTRLQSAVASALEGERHRVEIAWNCAK